MVEQRIEKADRESSIDGGVKQKLPKFCKNAKCCGQFNLYSEIDGHKVLVPLKKAEIKCKIEGAIAMVNIDLTYVNFHKENPIECTYILPVEDQTLISSFRAAIGDKVVNSKVVSEENAVEKYEDAIASGKFAIMVQRRTKNSESMTIKLGNLMPE